MSNYSSEEELGDSLQIKPPQLRPKMRNDRLPRRDHYESSYHNNRQPNFHRRDLEGIRRREFDVSQQHRRGDGTRSTRHYYPNEAGDRIVRRKKVVRDKYGPPDERYLQTHHPSRTELDVPSSSYKSATPSPLRAETDSRQQLQKHKKKRKHAEEEEERIFREIERRRERERQRDDVRQRRGDGDGSGSSGSQKRSNVRRDVEVSSSPRAHSRPRQPQSDNDDGEMLDLTVSDEDVQNLLPRIEVEDVDMSHSEEEQKSPQHSDLSESEAEVNDDRENSEILPNQNAGTSNAPSDISSDSGPEKSQSESSNESDSEDSESDSSSSASSQEGNEKGSKKNGKLKPKKQKVKPSNSDSEKEDHKMATDDCEEIVPLEKDSTTSNEGLEKIEIKEEKPVREMTDIEKACHELEKLPPYYPAIQGCRRVEEFQLLNRIEEGTYGVVYRAKDKRTNEVVALKRLKMEKEKDGFPITSLREINTLLKAQHENIVTVREIVVGSNTDKIFLVMDYVEHDLKSLMETLKQKKQEFIMGEIKCLLRQLLRAVAHLHDNWILHRDLKTSNLLLSHKGILKVGDFGLAREYGSPLKSYTPIVVTLWYRAPELLLGAKEYSTPIDVWSVGCIFGELLKMEAMFPGKSEANQLNLIFQTLGTPNDKIWSGYSKLPLLQKMTFGDYPVNKLKTRFGILSDTGIDLMNKFLTYNPAKRITAEEALEHPFFREAPLPIDPSIFPTWPAKSEMGARKHASPKPPSGGRQYKDLKEDDSVGFFLGVGDRRPPLGAGFSLKF